MRGWWLLVAVVGCSQGTAPRAPILYDLHQTVPDTIRGGQPGQVVHFGGEGEFVIPRTGVWAFEVQVTFTGAAGEHLIFLSVNGRSRAASGELFSPDSVHDFVNELNMVDTLAAGDTVVITGGSKYTVETDPGWTYLRFSGQ